jgi:hypothetical protein
MENTFTVESSKIKSLSDNSKRLNIFYKIYLWWKFEGKYSHIKIMTGIVNLIRWFPIIWKDRDYDYNYIWEILKTKIKFQAKYIGDRDHHVRAKRDSEIMMLCARLIDLIQNEHYESEYSDYHYSEMYFVPISDEDLNDMDDDSKKVMKGGSTLQHQEIWEKFDNYFAKYPHAYREVTKTDTYILTNDSKEKIAMNMGYYLHRKANRILFMLLERNITNWWD